VFYEVLKGANTTSERLLIGTNDRTFVSQGIQSSAAWRLPELGPLGQRLQLGVRIHNDSIERLHTNDTFEMRGGIPVADGGPTTTTTQNDGRAIAFAGYAIDELTLGPVLLTPGFRIEHIDTRFEDAQSGEVIDGVQRVLLPGAGVVYQPIDAIAILGGVHMGFSPLTPGQSGDVEPEVAVNYELGARLTTRWLGLEATRFISDYSNLTPACTFSAGCAEEDIDTQFNAGEARISGVEAVTNITVPTPIDLELPIKLTYTFTRTRFLTSFTSSNPQLGDVQAGDELPSVPKHQAGGTVGMLSKKWGGLNFGFTYMDGMRETAGSGTPAPGEETDSFVVIDASAQLIVLPELALYGKVENLLNNSYIVSRRPFGARPGRPRFIYGGVKILIDR
jgi:Fe(3+) dicitrate transport protein